MTIDIDKKLAGVLIPVFALRREGDLGIGDVLCMKEAIDFCARNGIAVLQTLPINETSGDNSPYNAISSVSLEPSLLAMTPNMVPGLEPAHLEEERKSRASASDRSALIDYPTVKSLKWRLLRKAFDCFLAQTPGELHADFTRFKQHHSRWLDTYSLFRTIVDRHNGNSRWTDWQSELRTVDGAKSWLAQQSDRADLEKTRDFWSYVQWVAYRQWADVKNHADRSNVRLMGDIPFGVSRYSADV